MPDPAFCDQSDMFRRLFDMSRDILCLVTDGCIAAVNPKGAHRLGWPASGLVGRPFIDLFHPDYQSVVRDAPELLAAGPVLLKALDAEGRTFDAEAELTSSESAADAVSLLTLRDVTERIGNDTEMVQDQDRFRRIVDLTSDMIALVADGVLTFVNPSGVSLLGARSAADLIGTALIDYVHSEYRPALQSGLTRLAEENDPLPIKLLRLDGRHMDVQIKARPLGDKPDSFLVDVHDVTQLRRSAERLAEREAYLQGILDAVADGIAIVRADGTILSFNPAAESIFGVASAQAAGQSIGTFIPEWTSLGIGCPIDDLLGRFQSGFLAAHPEMVGRRTDGASVPIEVSVSSLNQATERLVIVAVRDVSERKRTEDRIRYQSTHDAVTRLPNRDLFVKRLDGAVRSSVRRGVHGAVLTVEVEGLKLVNDSLGYEIGDAVLTSIAKRLIDHLSPDCFLARLSGKEFGVVVHELSAEYEAAILARKLIEAVDEPVTVNDMESHVAAIVGIACFPRDGEDVSTLLRNASAAVSQAKEQGRGSLVFYTNDLDRRLDERLRLRTGLSHALDNDEFSLLYQPKVSLATGRISGVEALLRWNHGPGQISPTKFIPVLEETALIGPVGRWVLETACTQQREWVEQGFRDLRMAVNLSVRQVRPGLVSMVENVLRRSGLAPDQLEIEITESLLFKDTENAISMMRALAELGVHLSIDDFGTGYSSLSYLKRLPLDAIKIDRSFITEMTDDTDAAEIVRTIVTMARSLRRRTVAEGVETPGQLAMLREFGCDEIQGYLFSRPVVADEVLAMLRSERTIA